MPNVPPSVLAVAISDLHLSLLRPSCRADKDWMGVQAEYLKQVREAAAGVPVLCAGDIFDRWNPPPELINFALKHLPDRFAAVPGQHDLPNHRIEDMHRSGYGVLVQADRIRDLSKASWSFSAADGFVVLGSGWNEEIQEAPPANQFKDMLRIALVHRYCWTADKKYPGAEDTSEVTAYKKQLKGYDVAFFGDNHLRFMADCGNCKVVNIGGFIRRKSDEIFRKPAMALLYSDGTVSWKKLDTSIDEFHDEAPNKLEVPIDMQNFIRELEKLGEEGLDFRIAVENHLRDPDIKQSTKEIILQALDSHE